jgi:hypothetical protein
VKLEAASVQPGARTMPMDGALKTAMAGRRMLACGSLPRHSENDGGFSVEAVGM